MSVDEPAPATAYAGYCENLRIGEIAQATFDVAWAGVRSRGTPLFQVCTEAGERNMTDQEDELFRRELRRWTSSHLSYTRRYDSPDWAEGTGRDS